VSAETAASLTRPADVCLDCLGVREGERVMILWSSPQEAVATAIGAAAEARRATVGWTRFETTADFAEPTADAAAEMARADVVFAATQGSVSHTAARRAASAAGARVASLAGITTETFARAVDVDYALLRSDGHALASRLTAGAQVRITSPAGTDLTLGIAGRGGRSDDGDLRAPGAFGNLPAGEAYIAPLEDGADGRLVVDGSIAEHGILSEAVEMRVAGGRLQSASGAVGAELLTLLDAAGTGGRHVAELGIGTNPAARIVGEILEDEKVRGTIHVAFGASAGIGGTNAVAVHVDTLVRTPTVEIDGVPVMVDGRLEMTPA
jgi:leucyl aminopeptidase (aminopeptidase T)